MRIAPVTEERPGWKAALARERSPVRLATTAGAVGAAWAFGALFLDTGGWSAVAALAPPAAAVAAWFAVASARDRAAGGEALACYLISIAHPLGVLVLAVGASIATGGGRGPADLVWTIAATLAVHALARRHCERRRHGQAPPALRRVTALGMALLVAGHVLLHMPDLLSGQWSDALRWWTFGIGIEGSAVVLALAIAGLAAVRVLRAGAPDPVPLEWLAALGVFWAWMAGWTGATATGLVLPALGISGTVLLSPLFAPRPAPGERLETGAVAVGLYALAAAWLAAVAAPGNIPEALGAPASGTAVLRWALLALLAYQVRDLIVWGVMTRLAPGERWTGALWAIWMAVSWVIAGEGLRAIGAGWLAAAFVGVPWGALGDADGTIGMPAAIAAASLLSAALAAGAYAWLALGQPRRIRPGDAA